MPTREFDRGKLFLGNDEMGFQPLGELEKIELDENYEMSKPNSILDIGGSHEFTADIKLPERMTIEDVILAFCGFDIERLKQNNWRKMHGMIMHRRVNRK